MVAEEKVNSLTRQYSKEVADGCKPVTLAVGEGEDSRDDNLTGPARNKREQGTRRLRVEKTEIVINLCMINYHKQESSINDRHRPLESTDLLSTASSGDQGELPFCRLRRKGAQRTISISLSVSHPGFQSLAKP